MDSYNETKYLTKANSRNKLMCDEFVDRTCDDGYIRTNTGYLIPTDYKEGGVATDFIERAEELKKKYNKEEIKVIVQKSIEDLTDKQKEVKKKITKIDNARNRLIKLTNEEMPNFITNSETELQNYTEYKGLSGEFKFKHLDIYGSLEKPLFLSTYIFQYIQGSNNHAYFIKRIKGKYKPEEYVVKYNAKILQKTRNGEFVYQPQNNVNFLTEMGLMKALYLESNEFTYAFQKIMLTFLKKIRQNQKEIWDKNLNEACDKIAKLEEANFYNNNIAKNMPRFQDFFDEEDQIGESDRKELLVLRYMHMKSIDVYVVNEDYVKSALQKKMSKFTSRRRHTCTTGKTRNKKSGCLPRKRGRLSEHGFSDSDDEAKGGYNSDGSEKSNTSVWSRRDGDIAFDLSNLDLDEVFEDDGVNYDLEYDCLNFMSIKSQYSNDNLYYYINPYTSKGKANDNDNYHKVFEMDIYNNDHYKSMMEKLTTDENSITPIKGVLRVSYNDIRNARSRTMIEKHYEPIFQNLRGTIKYRGF